MMKGLEHLSFEEGLRAENVQPGIRKACRGEVINMYKHLNRGCKEEGVRFFSVVHKDRTRDQGHKLEHGRCSMNTGRAHCCWESD